MSPPDTLPRVVGLTDRALERIYDHVFANDDHEVAGVLVGQPLDGGGVQVRSSIAAHGAQAQRDSVTFTHDAWELIYRELDSNFPGEQIVGWYHSHPGFGIFFSHHDAVAHRTSFVEPWQIALVIDPQEGTQGIFGWRDGEIECVEPESLTLREGTGTPTPAPLEPLAEETADETAEAEERSNRYDPVAIVVPFVVGLVLAVVAFAAFSGGEDQQREPETKPSSTRIAPGPADEGREPKRDAGPDRESPAEPQSRVPTPTPGALPTRAACEKAFQKLQAYPPECQEVVTPKGLQP